MRAIPQAVIDLIKSKEQCVLFVYDDAHYPPRPCSPGKKIDGKLTAGYGHTGDDISAYLHVDQRLADAWLIDDLNVAVKRLYDRIGADIIELLTENQYAALIDFVYNAGADPKSTIWKRLKAKQFDQVPLELAKFVNTHIDGKLVKESGLVKRRNAEIELWSKGEPGSVEIVRPSSATRDNLTPPTPSDPVPVTQSKSIITGVIGSVAAAPVMIDQVSHAIEPYAKHSELIEKMLGGLAVAAAICVAISIIYMFIQKRKARN